MTLKGLNDGMSTGTERIQSPGRVFLAGLVAGIVLLLIGTLAGFFLGGWESIIGSQLLWLISPLAAAAAAGGAAFEKGGTRGRVIGMAFLALFITVFVSGPLDYVMLWTMIASGSDPELTAEPTAWLWRRHLLISFTAITVGALIGMMFGKGIAQRRD
jgi:hypothetical protein